MAASLAEPTGTHPFSAFEWMLSLRYLRARRKEGFISVIAGFSFLGIMLGVATLIIVMAVMNGFRQELLTKILGLNGHLLIVLLGGEFPTRTQIELWILDPMGALIRLKRRRSTSAWRPIPVHKMV